MKLKAKFLLLGVLVVLGNLLTLFIVSNYLSGFEADFKSFDKAGVRIDHETLAVARDTNSISRLTRSIMLGDNFSNNSKAIDKTIEAIKKSFSEMKVAAKEIQIVSEKDRMLGLIATAEADSLAFFEDARARMQKLADVERTPELLRSAWAEYQTAATPMANKSRESFKALIDAASSLMEQTRTSTTKSLESVRTVLIAAVAIVVIVSLVIVLLIARTILVAVHEASRITDTIAAGNLTEEISATGKDELGQMLVAMQRMQEHLRGVVSRILKVEGSLATASQSLAETTSTVRQQSEEQANATTSIASTIEELTVSINHVMVSADESNTIANTASRLSSDGIDAVEHTVSEIREISDSVNQSTALMDVLHERSKDIAAIVIVIKEIAEQTNLLALNATIEAARAGEQGRGFAVVADEVRKLAERTTNSTHEISQIVLGIQEAATQVGQQMRGSTAGVAKGVIRAEAASAAIYSLRGSAQGAAQAAADISSALKEQAEASNQISRSVEIVAQMTERNSNAVTQVASSASELQYVSNELRETIAFFRI